MVHSNTSQGTLHDTVDSIEFTDYSNSQEPSAEELDIVQQVQDNGIILAALDDLWLLRGGYQEVVALTDLGEYASALTSLDHVYVKLHAFEDKWTHDPEGKPKLVKTISEELAKSKQSIVDAVFEEWDKALQFSSHREEGTRATVSLKIKLSDDDAISYDTLLDSIKYLDHEEIKKNQFVVASKLDSFLKFVENHVFKPILELRVGSVFLDDGDTLVLLDVERRLEFVSPLKSVHGLDIVTKELVFAIEFLKSSLAAEFPSLYDHIKRRSLTRLLSTLMGKTFPDLLPGSEAELPVFETELEQAASRIQDTLIGAGWLSSGSDDLTSWAKNLSEVWVSHKKQLALDEIRQRVLEIGAQPILKLERVEDAEFSGSQEEEVEEEVKPETPVDTDGWDNWNEDEEEPKKPEKEEEEEEEEESDAWDAWGDDPVEEQKPQEEEDSWGAWEEEDKPAPTPAPKKHDKPKVHHEATGTTTTKESATRRQEALMCSISEVPGAIIATIQNFVDEIHAYFVHHSKHQGGGAPGGILHHSEHAHEAKLVEANVADMLALYRALSPLVYGAKGADSDRMLPFILYNDVISVVSRLSTVRVEGGVGGSAGQLAPVAAENERLFALADAQYSGVVSQQQARLGKVLARAQGFARCNGEENLFACQGAVERTVNIFHELAVEWAAHVSFPLRARALGVLLEYVAATVVRDIEAQESVSEEESNELGKLVRGLLQLEGLFVDPVGGGGGGSKSGRRAALYYTPSWVRLEYLGRILVSNQEEILAMLRNNELVDFTARELDSLVQALFAPSEYRAQTIQTIYNGGI